MAAPGIGAKQDSVCLVWLLSRTLREEHLVDRASCESIDEMLMARIALGDDVAFATLLDRHLDPVHNYLLRMTRSVTDAEDLAQETFFRVWQKAQTYQPGRVKASTWIHTIAHNVCIDAVRKHRESTTDVLPETADGTNDPALLHSAAEQQRKLLDAINRLPDKQRSALLLCQVQGFSNAEAASIVGTGLRALESLLARARRALRAELTDNGASR